MLAEPRDKSTAQTLDTPLAPMTVAFIVASIFVLLRLGGFGWDPTGFVQAGDRFVIESEAPEGLSIQDEVGYDGQGFYRLALDPATRDRTAHGIILDLPHMRHQRILYPGLTWLVARGDPARTAWMLIGINLVGMAAIGALGGAIARTFGRHALMGTVFPAWPGFAVALGVDTAEIIAGMLLLAGVLALRRRWAIPAAVALTLAALARETTLLLPIGIAIGWAVNGLRNRGRKDDLPEAAFLIPIGTFAAWQIFLGWWWGTAPLSEGREFSLATPLRGLWPQLRGWLDLEIIDDAYNLLLFALLVAFAWMLARTLRHTEAETSFQIAAAVALLLVLVLSGAVWRHYWGMLRGLTELYLLGTVVVLGARRAPVQRYILAGAVWVSVAVQMSLYP